MRRILQLFTALLLFCGVNLTLKAQDRTVTGKVTSTDDGSAIPGASIIVKGTTTGSTTGSDGKYSISVSDNATLVFSFVGMVAQEVPVGNRSTIDVQLVPNVQSLSEVVVIAFGAAQKGTFTGSAGQIDSKQLETRPLTNVATALAGTLPGVQTNAGSGQPGSGPDIRIRGFGSINASNDPLYVVDGVPYSGNISNLNVDDIASISVLKDASSTALYGARAANGVVMITTKRGSKDREQLSLKAETGFSSRAIPEYEVVNAYQYYPLMWEAYRNSLAYARTNPYPMEQANQVASGLAPVRGTTRITGIAEQLAYNPFNVPNNQVVLPDGTINPEASLLYPGDLDWEAPMKRRGSRSDYVLSYSGGSDKTDYFASLGYLSEKGFFIRTDFERISARVNVNTQPLSWFKTGFNLAGNTTRSNTASDGSSTGFVNPFFFTRNIGPIYPVYARDRATGELILDEKGQPIFDYGNRNVSGLLARPSGAFPGRHIVAETQLNNDELRRQVLSARTFGEITFLKDFKFRTNLAADISNFKSMSYDNNLVGDGAPAGRASRTVTSTTSYNLNQLLTYNRTFGRHTVEALVGHENYDWTYEYLYGFRQGIIAEGNTELGNFTTVNSLTSRTDKYRTEGYLSRLSYNFDEKYSFSASYRRDGTSRFSQKSRWGNFWSVGAAWRIDQEKLFNLPQWVNMLKLRASHGVVGSDAFLTTNSDGTTDPNYYPYQALYAQGPGVNNGIEPGFLFSSLANEDLVWESNATSDIGLDFELLNRRLTGTVEFFNRQSSNLLFEVPLPVSSGIPSINQNIGAMYNRGLELQLGADVVRAGDFTWNVNFNFTSFINRITKLPQEEIISGTKKLKVGQSLYDYWLRSWYGVDPADGAGLYRAAPTAGAANLRIMENGDSVTTVFSDARFDYHGSAIPDFSGGISNTFSFKGLTLSVLLNYQKGGLVYDATYAALMGTGSYGRALHVDQLRRWRNPGDVTDVPRPDITQSAQYNAQSSRFLTDASFLNIRSANLSYNFPKSLASKIRLSNLRIYLTGENLLLFSERKGMNVTQAFTGVTSNRYTPSRIITAGLNVTL